MNISSMSAVQLVIFPVLCCKKKTSFIFVCKGTVEIIVYVPVLWLLFEISRKHRHSSLAAV